VVGIIKALGGGGKGGGGGCDEKLARSTDKYRPCLYDKLMLEGGTSSPL
jgi:hypothetical protein